MKNTNPIFSLKNFRSFGEDGADFELAPITVLTGCNSAGKSSLVKALMLLSPGVENVSYTNDLKFSSKDLCLGGYKNVSHKDGEIIMSYKIWSANLQEHIIVTREYCAKHNDKLNDGALYHLKVEKLDGTLIYQIGPGWINGYLEHDVPQYKAVREEFNRFYAVGCYMRLLVLLPILKKRDAHLNDSNHGLDKRRDKYLEIAKERLVQLCITEDEAVLLWEEFNHKTFNAVIKAQDTALGFGENLLVTLKDVTKDVDDDEINMMIETFIDHIVEEACSPFFTQHPVYINSASAQIERLYTVGNDNKMCNAFRELNRRNMQYHDEIGIVSVGPYLIHKPGSFLDKWLQKFEICDGVEIKGTDEGLGLMAYTINGNEKRLLADEGYGISQLVALLLQIDNCIPIAVSCDEDVYLKENRAVYSYKPQIICVEEPEIHLHPKYQSMLAEMFVEAYQKYNIHFIIETHSEYLIRKLQVMVADKNNAITANDVSLNYVEKVDGESTNRKIEILEDGRLNSSFGTGFFDEADNRAMDLLHLKATQK